ncbi:pilus assembly protein TadB, partial [Kineococcus sp. T13]|nr:pilus assembly protein TadB [Kineococcus vitellinus]
LLGVAVLVAPPAGAPGARVPSRGGGRPRSRRPPRPRQEDALLAGARLAERAAALLRAGVPPALVWHHAAPPAAPAAAPAARPPAGATGAVRGGPVGPAAPPATAPLGVRAVWELVERTGAPAAQALEASAAGLRADASARAAVRTALAGASVSARTVSLLPLLGLVLGAALGAPPWEALLGSAPGRLSALLGTGLLVLGRVWSARLVRGAERAAR